MTIELTPEQRDSLLIVLGMFRAQREPLRISVVHYVEILAKLGVEKPEQYLTADEYVNYKALVSVSAIRQAMRASEAEATS